MRKLLGLCAALVVGFLALSKSHAQTPAATAPGAQAPEAAQPAKAAESLGSKVWIGHYSEYEEYLKTAAIAKVGDIPVGVTKPKRAFFEPGGIAGSAAMKYLPAGVKGGFWEAYKS